jgi:predicted RNase H-like HicB family nuclease
MKYPVIFEPTPTGFSAYVPDLPGCVSTGENLDEARALIAEAIAFHIAGMREDGESIPEPSVSEMVDVAG